MRSARPAACGYSRLPSGGETAVSAGYTDCHRFTNMALVVGTFGYEIPSISTRKAPQKRPLSDKLAVGRLWTPRLEVYFPNNFKRSAIPLPPGKGADWKDQRGHSTECRHTTNSIPRLCIRVAFWTTNHAVSRNWQEEDGASVLADTPPSEAFLLVQKHQASWLN